MAGIAEAVDARERAEREGDEHLASLQKAGLAAAAAEAAAEDRSRELARMQAEHQRAKGRMEKAIEEAAQAGKELDRLRGTAVEAQQDAAEKGKVIASVTAQLDDANARLRQVRQEALDAANQRDMLTHERDDCKHHVESLTRQLEGEKAQGAQRARQVSDATSRVEQLQKDSERQAAAAERAESEANKRIRDLEQQLMLSRREAESVRADMQSTQTERDLANGAAAENARQVGELQQQQQAARIATEKQIDDLEQRLAQALEGGKQVQAAVTGEGDAALASVGLVVKQSLKSQAIVVAQVLAGSSAAESKLKVGDCITQVGVKRIVGLSASEVQELLAGPVGTEVVIKAARAESAKLAAPKPGGGGGAPECELEVVLCRGGKVVHRNEHADELCAMLLRVPDVCTIVRQLRAENQELQASATSLREDMAHAEEEWQSEFAALRGKLEGEAERVRKELQQAQAAHAAVSEQHLEVRRRVKMGMQNRENVYYA